MFKGGQDLFVEEMKSLDVEEVYEIELDSFSLPWREQTFHNELAKEHAKIFVARTKVSRVVGYVCVWLIEDKIHIQNIATHVDFRRRGVATALLMYLIDMATGDGKNRFFLEVRPSNSPALLFYEKHGFKRIGIRTCYYPDTGEDAIVMALDLQQSARERHL